MKKQAFTLIELLVVIGVLAVLVVTILITLNSSEAQKKARDTKRMKDMRTLEAIILQYINDGNPPLCQDGNGCNSMPSGPSIASDSCSASWIGTRNGGNRDVNLCAYTKSIPVDPLNGRDGTIITGGGTAQNPATDTVQHGVGTYFQYILKMKGSDYKIAAFQESKSNWNNIVNDGGSNPTYLEVGSEDISL